MESVDIEKVNLPDNVSPEAQTLIIEELLKAVKSLKYQFDALVMDLDDTKKIPSEYVPSSTRIEDVIEGESGTGEWRRHGKVWIDPQGYVRNQHEYEQYQVETETSAPLLAANNSEDTAEQNQSTEDL